MRGIVTTTIHGPTRGLLAFASLDSWRLYVVADKKTPAHLFDDLPCTFIDCETQQERWPELSARIGWNKPERRVLGFLAALADGADVIASVDDDVVPNADWGRDLLVGREVEVDLWRSESGVLDPYAVCVTTAAWHRGYPVDMLPGRACEPAGRETVAVDFQVDLCDGELDVDAFYRLQCGGSVREGIKPFAPFSTTQPAPFSTQCTVFTAAAARAYMMPLGVGRVHDIWASWAVQAQGFRAVFCPPSAAHERPPHDIKAEWIDELQTYGRARGAAFLAHQWHAEDLLAYRRCLPC